LRGDSVFHVYGVHEGRSEDSYFGTFRVRDDAQAHIAKLDSQVMHGQNWAQRYHDRGFVIREHLVSTDFEIPPRPIPRESYVMRTSPKANEPGTWDSTIVEVSRRRGRGQLEPICAYERDHAMFQTFEPSRLSPEAPIGTGTGNGR
jgi:hypothetical protein